MKTLRHALLLLLTCAGLSWAQMDLPAFLGGNGNTSPGMPGFEAPEPTKLTATGSASVRSFKAGTPFYVAYNGSVEAPWHGYWMNPGTVGEPMTAKITAPEGFEVKGPFWSAPEWHNGVIGAAYVYEHPVVVWEITPKSPAEGPATFTMTGVAQVCSDEGCLAPQTAEVQVTLSSGDGAANEEWKGQEKQVAGLNETPIALTAVQDDANLTLILKDKPQVKEIHFFPTDNTVNPVAEQKYDAATGHLVMPRFDGKDPMYPMKDESLASSPLKTVEGVLVVDGAVHSVSLDMAAEAEANRPGFFEMLAIVPDDLFSLCFSLFLGGLILNLMPCVFPVIGLKVMSFVEMGGGSKKKVLLHSMTFVAGILVSFLILSLLLVIMLPSGDRSWATWMQNEWVVYVILLLLLGLGLNMSGVFEIGVSATGAAQGVQSKGGLLGSFLQGLFVTVVATPCSAPFLGTTLPVAMALPDPWLIIAMFFMGLGLATPYIVLGFFPSLVRLLPQPGEWMESLKQGLSFLLYAAAAWFLYIYMAFFTDEVEMMWMMIALVPIAAALWVYGRWCPIYCSVRSRIIGGIIALLLAGVGVFYSMPHSHEAAADSTDSTAAVVSHEWVAWTPKAMEKALADGKPVYVDFTAKWCATCQSNKKFAYTDEVYELFAKGDVVLMRADKTKPNADIDAEMRRLKRSSVPVNALYLPGAEPVITREVFGSDYMKEFLETNLPKGDAKPAAPADATDEDADDEDDDEDDEEEEGEEEEGDAESAE